MGRQATHHVPRAVALVEYLDGPESLVVAHKDKLRDHGDGLGTTRESCALALYQIHGRTTVESRFFSALLCRHW